MGITFAIVQIAKSSNTLAIDDRGRPDLGHLSAEDSSHMLTKTVANRT
ncbi:MAG: hypothetical protein N838_08380 [Thiohalocapsa sp. PB-PSB1]|nr:MAG: hypothetical protein N838_08380 [Thiohalocapsa sp. PB-PSB1]